MSLTTKELQRIRGIGSVLAARLLESGYDSFRKIAALDEHALKAIQGINPRAIADIREQALRLAGAEAAAGDGTPETLSGSFQRLRETVQVLTASAGERYRDQLTGKAGRKLSQAVVRFLEVLDELETKADKKPKRTGKRVARAGERLDGLDGGDLQSLRKGLKKARKTLQRIPS